jgi:RNA polymerase sigma-70 factor (ECF subfamily)
MRDVTLSHLDRLTVGAADDAHALVMDEDEFRLFYDRTARAVWAYLARLTGDPRTADDLLQESYYRFLRARVTHESDDHRRNYLFRIATNLARDLHRRPHADSVRMDDTFEPADPATTHDAAGLVADRLDVSRAMARLKPRDRNMLWLAYANGSTHEEIAQILGLRAGSIKLMLYRARRRLAALLPERAGIQRGSRS